MIDIKKVIHDFELMEKNLAKRSSDIDLRGVIKQFELVKSEKQKLEILLKDANAIADKVKRSNSAQRRKELVERALLIKVDVAKAKSEHDVAQAEFDRLLAELPNWIAPEVPTGRSDEDNLVLREVGQAPVLEFSPLDHVDLGRRLDILDFDAGTKVAGSKFYFLKREAVLLQHAIKSYVFEKAMKAGFIPLQTPDICHNHILEGVGFSPKGDESNTYLLDGLEKSLIATAEICVGGMHAGEILDAQELPLLYVAESHCFRREAGAAGRSGKGLYRVHQFEKVELFVICHPDQSGIFHERVLSLQEEIYSELNIPYRVVLNCSGDLGAPAYKKYDLEAWMPGKGENGEYGEITSASNCTDYQARRLGIKFRNPKTKKNEYVHTLNGTASALGRTMVAIFENYQNPHGGVKVPTVLQKYLDRDVIGPAR